MIPLLLLAVQAPERVSIDPPTQAAPEPRWSIQADPYADAPYRQEQCPEQAGDTVVVCARPNTELRLPLPAERGPPDGPRTSVAYLDGAEMPQAAPCATMQKGCTVGLDLIGSARVLYKAGKRIVEGE
jgi:hypothetical protein